MKFQAVEAQKQSRQCRSPQGERGLKCPDLQRGKHDRRSLSARRAWIEICLPPPAGGRGGSLSARRAWIEIVGMVIGSEPVNVALRKESVD